MASQTQPSSSRTVSTPNPEQMAVVVSVASHLIEEGKNPKVYTPYKDTPSWMDKTLIGLGYGEYLFTETSGGGDQMTNFFFARPLYGPDGKITTNSSGVKPFESHWSKFGNHRWPPMLKGLAFIQDENFPQATNLISDGVSGLATAPKNYVRDIYVQEVNEGSRFLLDELLSPYPFKIARFPVPQPGRVSYQINGLRGAFEECLHDDIEIPDTDSATVTYLGGTVASGTAKIPGQFFPRTNFRRRRPYVLAVDQERRNGVWYMQRLRVFPPRQPRTTVSA